MAVHVNTVYLLLLVNVYGQYISLYISEWKNTLVRICSQGAYLIIMIPNLFLAVDNVPYIPEWLNWTIPRTCKYFLTFREINKITNRVIMCWERLRLRSVDNIEQIYVVIPWSNLQISIKLLQKFNLAWGLLSMRA